MSRSLEQAGLIAIVLLALAGCQSREVRCVAYSAFAGSVRCVSREEVTVLALADGERLFKFRSFRDMLFAQSFAADRSSLWVASPGGAWAEVGVVDSTQVSCSCASGITCCCVSPDTGEISCKVGNADWSSSMISSGLPGVQTVELSDDGQFAAAFAAQQSELIILRVSDLSIMSRTPIMSSTLPSLAFTGEKFMLGTSESISVAEMPYQEFRVVRDGLTFVLGAGSGGIVVRHSNGVLVGIRADGSVMEWSSQRESLLGGACVGETEMLIAWDDGLEVAAANRSRFLPMETGASLGPQRAACPLKHGP